jgi:radical SAM superfamily enzyme YgiQ (UPF0313 family)
LGGLEVKILDGSLMSHAEQLEEIRRFRPNVAAFNPTIASQENANECAEFARRSGALVVYGGVNSTNLWKQILTNRPYVDCVGLFEGEIPMFLILNRLRERKILGNDCFEGIPNLAYRDSKGNIHPPSSIYVPWLDELPDIDYSLLDLERFFAQTQKRGFGKAITYYAGKGCSKRGRKAVRGLYDFDEYNELVKVMDVCTFCGRNELGLRNFPQDREARVLRKLHEQYGVTGFFNVQDTVNLKNTAPIGLDDCWFRLFIGLENVTPENIRRLKRRYGPNLILQVGIESATPEMRAVYGKKPADMVEVITKTRRIQDEGVQLHASFIADGRGHTEDSLKRTIALAWEMAGYDCMTWLLISPQLVLPGSPDYKALLQMPRMAKKYANADVFNIAEISGDFLRYFAPGLTREKVIGEIKGGFDAIRRRERTTELVLDVKGVTPEEEEYINPNRRYCEEG